MARMHAAERESRLPALRAATSVPGLLGGKQSSVLGQHYVAKPARVTPRTPGERDC